MQAWQEATALAVALVLMEVPVARAAAEPQAVIAMAEKAQRLGCKVGLAAQPAAPHSMVTRVT